jgi:hypothetical protein
MSDQSKPETCTLATTTEDQPGEAPPPHPVADAIDRYLHSTLDIHFAARAFIPAAATIMKNQAAEMKAGFDHAESLMAESDPGKRAHGLKLALASMRKARRLQYSRLPSQIENSLFVNLFSSFDVFTGELISALHLKKPALFDRLNRTVPLSTVLAASSIEMLKASVLDEEIETFRRKSYSEQFDYLESTFGIVLRKFDRWPDFVEAGQRRNLFTHCGGVVSEQYRAVCLREGYSSTQLPTVGTKLQLGGGYFLATCELMHEVGLKLGQTLWRKVLPQDLEAADKHLNSLVYEALSQEQWVRAEITGEFFANQKNLFSDLYKRMAIMNFAIALKHRNKIDEMKKALLAHDWSASIPEFRLAEAVLCGRTDEACQIIKSIGPKGQLISENAYHSWPLFRDLREDPKFHDAYESVYGYPFVSKVQLATREERNAIELSADIKEEAKVESDSKQEKELPNNLADSAVQTESS